MNSKITITNKKLIEYVKNNKKVYFDFYRDSALWYKTECGLLFEVPINDTGKGVFKSEDRAMSYLRWIRKQLEANRAGMIECGMVIEQ
jgi:hypothetical protein